MASTCGEEGCSANQNMGFQSHDNKKQEDGGYFCFVMRHNADKHYLLFDVYAEIVE